MKKISEFLKNILPFNGRTDMPKALYAVKIFLAFWLVKFAGEIAAEAAVIGLHFACGKNPLAGEVFDTRTITLITYYGYIIVIAAALLYWKLIIRRPLWEMGLNGRFGCYFIGAALGAVLILISVSAVTLAGAFRFNGVFANVNCLMILAFFGGFIVQGAMEEILCRGIVLHSLKDKMNIWAAVAVSTLVFILPHCSGVFAQGPVFGAVGIVNLVLISIIFSLLTLRLKSLWVACGLHSFWNAILFCVLGLNLSGSDEAAAAVFDMSSVGENILNGGVYGIEASVITTAVLAAAAALLWLTGRKQL